MGTEGQGVYQGLVCLFVGFCTSLKKMNEKCERCCEDACSVALIHHPSKQKKKKQKQKQKEEEDEDEEEEERRRKKAKRSNPNAHTLWGVLHNLLKHHFETVNPNSLKTQTCHVHKTTRLRSQIMLYKLQICKVLLLSRKTAFIAFLQTLKSYITFHRAWNDFDNFYYQTLSPK